jgi:hypothetical protein
MIPLKISIISKSGSAKLLGSLETPIAKYVLKRRLSEAAIDIRAALIKETPRDTGLLANAHGYAYDATDRRMVIFNRRKYAVAVHEGRKPGKRPPIEALIPWCRRHIANTRIANALAAGSLTAHQRRPRVSRDEARSFAFLLARAIGRRGTKPNRWFERVLTGYGLQRIDKAAQIIGNDLGRAIVAGSGTVTQKINRTDT